MRENFGIGQKVRIIKDGDTKGDIGTIMDEQFIVGSDLDEYKVRFDDKKKGSRWFFRTHFLHGR